MDGDRIRCANLPASVRLVGIDAPGDGQAAKRAMAQLLARDIAVLWTAEWLLRPNGGASV